MWRNRLTVNTLVMGLVGKNPKSTLIRFRQFRNTTKWKPWSYAHCTRRLRLTLIDSGRLRVTSGDSGQLQTTPDNSKQLRTTTSDPGWLRITPDDFGRLRNRECAPESTSLEHTHSGAKILWFIFSYPRVVYKRSQAVSGKPFRADDTNSRLRTKPTIAYWTAPKPIKPFF